MEVTRGKSCEHARNQRLAALHTFLFRPFSALREPEMLAGSPTSGGDLYCQNGPRRLRRFTWNDDEIESLFHLAALRWNPCGLRWGQDVLFMVLSITPERERRKWPTLKVEDVDLDGAAARAVFMVRGDKWRNAARSGPKLLNWLKRLMAADLRGGNQSGSPCS